ncbi:MAG: hypothetical protein ACYC27_00050 [Armatimonadota bacterium]
MLITDNKVSLISRDVINCSFSKFENKWKIDSFRVWNSTKKAWDDTYSPFKGEFLYLGAKPDFTGKSQDGYLYADRYEPIRRYGVQGIKFYGSTRLGDTDFQWNASYYFDKKDKLPLLHSELIYKVDKDIELGYSPKVLSRTIADGDTQHGSMTHIISYEQSEKPVLIEKGYPLIWMNSKIGAKTFNTLLINEVEQDSPAGRYFIFNRSPEAPYYSYWSIGSMKRWEHEFGKYYWNYRDPATGLYPEETSLIANKEYKIKYAAVYGFDQTNLQFYRKYWDKAFDYVTPMESIPFWAKNWDECAQGQIKEFKDDDHNAGDRYVDGVGYYSAPVKDKMSHGASNVCWHGTANIIHAMLYYTWATGDKENYDFYAKRLANANFPKWAQNSAGDKGWINEFWTQKDGYIHWCSMWASLDFGAYNLYNCYKLTGDKTYWNLFKGMIDYVKTDLITNKNTLGEHWNDNDKQWYYLTPESAFTKAQKVEKGEDPGDYPGSLSVYAYLCLLTYNETKDITYRNDAFKYIDHINTFISKPQDFWTLCRVPKTNGFAFACLSNIKRYELTKEAKYLDYAEEWAYLLMTNYHLKSEGHEDIGLAHASALGVFDYVCVSSLETIEPMYLMTNLLKYRVNPALLKYLALADRRHLIAYPANHPDKKFDYQYIPMELIPQRDSFAMYMAGAVMIENVMLHGLQTSSDSEITVICLDAAETGLNLKTSRNMIAYNPTSKNRTFNLKLKGFNNGQYKIKAGAKIISSISNESMQKTGIDISLDAQKWVRITIDSKK